MAVKHLEKWGRHKAQERYGSLKSHERATGEHQAPQAPEDKHADKYENDTPSNWLRGLGKSEAEGKPNFDNHKGKR